MASFRGQEIFPKVSGDVPRYTKKVYRKKCTEILTLVQTFRDFSWTQLHM